MRISWLALLAVPGLGCAVDGGNGAVKARVSAGADDLQTLAAAQFGACPADLAARYPQLTCATIQVPLDYAHPEGETISLLVSKAPATNPAKRRGVLLVNRGGPGLDGTGMAGSRSRALPAVAEYYDFIGFDPRGVNHSTPLHCTDPSFWNDPQPDPDSLGARQQNWDKQAAYSQACANSVGKYLPYMSTETHARDMESIRRALGEDKISFFGISWGTYLGAVYAQLFPEHVSHMILAGNVDPTPSGIWYQAFRSQDQAVQNRLYDWFHWIARYDQVFHLGIKEDEVMDAFYGALAQIRANPHGVLGPQEFINVTWNTMYLPYNWIDLAQAVSDFLGKHDDSGLVAQVGDGVATAADENNNAAFRAVLCNEGTYPLDRSVWESDAAQDATTAPLGSWFNMWSIASCQNWSAPRRTPVTITGQGLPPILMFNTLGDPATPYSGALKMHAALPSSLLVTVRAGHHGGWGYPGLEDTDQAMQIGFDYLNDDLLPAGDITIAGAEPPDPTQPSLRAMTAEVRQERTGREHF